MNPWRKHVLNGIGVFLAATIALAILGVITGQDSLWGSAMGSLLNTTLYGSVLWFTVRWLDEAKTRPMGIQSCCVLLMTMLLFQIAIWANPILSLTTGSTGGPHWDFIGKITLCGFAILGTGIPSLLGLSAWCQYGMKRTGWTSQIVAIITLGCWIVAILYDHNPIQEKMSGTGALLLGCGALASGILLGEKNKRWNIAQWIGVAGCFWLLLIGLMAIWVGKKDVTPAIWTGPLTVSLWIGFVSLSRLLIIPRQWRWMHPVSQSLAAVGLLAFFVLTCIEDQSRWDNPHATLPFFLSRGGLIAMILTIGLWLFMAVLNRANKKLPAEIIDPNIKTVDLTCPRCQRAQSVGVGQASCSQCGLKFKIDVYSPVCAKCGYVLYGIDLTACPDCGHPTPPTHTTPLPPLPTLPTLPTLSPTPIDSDTACPPTAS